MPARGSRSSTSTSSATGRCCSRRKDCDRCRTGNLYELWLTKDGRLAEPCGRFAAESDGVTVVPLNAPYRLDEYDAWVVVKQGSDAPLLRES